MPIHAILDETGKIPVELLPSGIGGGSSIMFSFKFESGRLKAWDLCGNPSIWVTENQRFWVDDATGEVKVL